MNLSPEQKEIHALKKALKESEREKEILKKAESIRPFGDDSQERKDIYQFMKDLRQDYAVGMMCRVFNVGRSGYNACLKRNPA